VILLLAGAAITAFYLTAGPARTTSSSHASMTGTMFVSDAGKSHGGFEYTASWNASLNATGGSGTLNLLLSAGLGDVLTKHQFAVTDFAKNSTNISMKIDGQSLTLVWIDNDPIWNGTYNHYYVASWGGYAPQNETRGSISTMDFPGLTSFWYVELRLR
jgi:hypothetical protein